jgi:tetratricopeptide (TPR) repeat protein
MSTQTLGLAYLEEFKLPEAEKEFKKFIKLSPDDKLGYANLGLTYLRMGRYPDAEKQLLKAINIAPKDPDIRLLLATVYQMNDQRKEAITQLKEALTFAPDHSKLLYFLSELYAAEQTPEAQKERFNYLLQLVQHDPGNLVPHLDLIDLYIKKGESDKAMEQMELIRKQFPEFPKEAMEYYNKVIPLLRKGDNQNALVQYTIFYNYLKVSAPYEAGMMEFKGPGGSLVGFPLISYDQQPGASSENKSILDVIKFTNVTATSGLNIVPSSGAVQNVNTIIATADYDNDGDEDLYVGSYDPATSSYKYWLFNNDMGAFKDLSQKVGIKHTGKESYATFADYDNDGFMDLYIVKENGDVLYRNAGKGFFEDVTLSSKVGSKSGGCTCLAVA